MNGTRFRLHLNLQNLSMISIAAKLWDSEDIKNRIKNNFSPVWEHVYPDENWCEISKSVVQYANSINLPPKLSVLLKNTIKLIGQKIYDWILYVTKILKLDLISTKKIYFSSGVVDEIKIFDLYWRSLMAPDNFMHQAEYFRHSRLFSLSCMYGCERFLNEQKNEMLDELSEFYPEIKKGDEIYNIMSVSICLTVGDNMLENVASPVRMFEVCLEAGFSKAAKFYWGKLDEKEKVSNLTNFAKKCWRTYEDSRFLMEKYCEILLFLINQMGEEEKSLFFSDYADKIIRLLLPVWPYQELIVHLLKYDWNIESSRSQNMALSLIRFSKRMNHLEFPLDHELLFQIMQKAWGDIPVNEKLSFLRMNRLNVSSFFLTLNPKILNLLFNDPSITELDGEKIDSLILEGFVELVKVGKFDFLKEIIKTIFYFIPEPKEFLRGKLSNDNFVRSLIVNDESFGFVDEFLGWLTESESEAEAERAKLKNKINTISVCRSLTEPRHGSVHCELADKFLKWRLETDSEIKSFKEEMKSYNFVILGFSGYVRIKSGDLSWLRPGDSLAMHPDEDPFDNADGFTFLKFEDATELNRRVVLGVKSFCLGVDHDFLGPDGCHTMRWGVNYVGTKVGDFIVFTVREIWSNKGQSYYSDFNLDKMAKLSNAFIKFYYETDDEVFKFKKTKLPGLVTENLIEFFLGAFESREHFPDNFLDDFCEFCMIPSEKIEEIKIQQRSDIENFLDTYLIDQLKFKLADYYLNWLFGEVNKTEVYKKVLNSSNKAALLCVSFLKEHGEFFLLGYRDPEICRWLSLVDDMEKLKNDVFALYGKTPKWFPALLERSAHRDVNPVG